MKYEKKMIQKLYTEPKEETIMGSFLSKPETLNTDKTKHLSKRKRKKKNMNKNNNADKCKDIKAMLKKFK